MDSVVFQQRVVDRPLDGTLDSAAARVLERATTCWPATFTCTVGTSYHDSSLRRPGCRRWID